MTEKILMPRRLILSGVGASVVPELVSTSAAHPVKIDLARGLLGGLPDGFVSERTGGGSPGAWAVIEDASVAGERCLGQTSADATDYRFPLAIYQKLPAANLDVTVRFKAVAGRVDRAAGIAIRLADADNYYVVRANALEDNVNFYRVVKGSRREIKGVSAKVEPGVWHTIGLSADRDKFTILFNGRVLFTTTDDTFGQAGKVALWTKADSITRFDALSIERKP